MIGKMKIGCIGHITVQAGSHASCGVFGGGKRRTGVYGLCDRNSYLHKFFMIGSTGMLQSHRWHNGRGLQGIVCNALPSDPMSSADMFDGEAGDGRKIFILEDMTYEQLSDFHMRLCENDVEYHDLKSMCKLNGLGGKDMKYNLRAKLIRKVREMLGKPVWDRRSYGRRVKLPTAMSDVELAKFYKQREVVMPDDKDDAIGLAFAMLVVDGAISQDVVPTTSAYDKLNTKRLIQLCQKRQLPTKGNKAELLARLVEYDAQKERKILADKAAEAARREIEGAAIDVPPKPPNRTMAADLREAQRTMASVNEMDLPFLRAALLARNLPVYGTSEVLVERLTNVLRRDVIDAHAGLGRMMKYAEAAVSKLSEEEIYEALASRGLASFSVSEDSNARLANALVEEWIHHAMNTPDGQWDDEEEDADSQEGQVDGAMADGTTVDPTLDVFFICNGATVNEREISLCTARELLPILQTDQIWGTLMPFLSSGQESFEDVLDTFEGNEVPSEQVDIMFLTPTINGVVASLSLPVAPQGCVFRVSATPVDQVDDGQIVSADSLSQDVVISGLLPGTAYEFNVCLINKIGEGPKGQPYHAATLLRQGLAVKVLYPVQQEDGSLKFAPLEWEELCGLHAGALDIILKGKNARELKNLNEYRSEQGIMLPLGPSRLLHENSLLGDVLASDALQGFGSDANRVYNDREALLKKAATFGFQTQALLKFSRDKIQDVFTVQNEIERWAAGHGMNIHVGRIAIGVQSNVLSGTIVSRGVNAAAETLIIIRDAVPESEDFSIVLEPVHQDAIFVDVTVVQGNHGLVTLVPTERKEFNVDWELEISDLNIEKFRSMDGIDTEILDRIVQMKQEDVVVPAAYADGVKANDAVRHLTPPTSLTAETVNHICLFAKKLFQQMGLNDFATFSFCVARERDLSEQERDEKAFLAVANGSADKPLDQDSNLDNQKDLLSFSKLLELDASVRNSREEAETAALRMSSAASTEVTVASGPDYGEIFGIKIDERTRDDIRDLFPTIPVDPIPYKLPKIPAAKELPDLSNLEISGLNQFLDKSTNLQIFLFGMQVIPNLESSHDSLVGQQLAASGLSWNWLTRTLISRAAQRQGLPGLLDEIVSRDEVEDAAEDWIASSSISETEQTLSGQNGRVTMEFIGEQIAKWNCGMPKLAKQTESPPSYDDILESNALLTEKGPDVEIEEVLEKSVATLNESEEEDRLEVTGDHVSNNAQDILAQQYPGLHPRRQRVWILCGGEGTERNESLTAAASAMRALQGSTDLLLETYMLDPPNSGVREEDRLSRLVEIREDLLKAGASDDMLFHELPYLFPTNIKNPTPTPPQDVENRGIWRLAGSSIVRDTVPDMRFNIDVALESQKTAVISRKDGDHIHEREKVVFQTKEELKLAGVPVDTGRAPWGGSLSDERIPTSPQYMNLKDWVTAASERCVVILMCVPGHPSAYGPLQELFDSNGVPYTGPSKLAADLCHDRPELLRNLTDAINYDGSIISAPPAHSISALELRATCQSRDSAEEFFSRLFGQWENKMMVIRPARECGMGILRLKSGLDLMLYNQAIQNCWDTICAEQSPTISQDVRMPLPAPTQFVIEPLLVATQIQIVSNGHENRSAGFRDDPKIGHICWPSEDSWLEIRGCLLGGTGTMRCLGLSTTIVQLSEEGEVTASFDASPPTSLLSEETARDTMLRLQLVADGLGLSGAAEICLLVNTGTGEIIVQDVNVHPDVSPNGLLVKQAALMSPPMSHIEVLRELLKEAMSRGEDSMDAEGFDTLYPAEEFSASMGSLLDAPDAPNPTQNYFGDPYLKVEEGYQYGFEGYAGVTEDDDDSDIEEFEPYDEFDSDVE